MNEIVVVGSGFGGIAAALRARSLGFNVTIIEKLKSLGGRAQVFKKDGFVFDAGPTVITAPQLFDELFLLFDKKRSDYIDLISLDVWYQFIFNDLSKFNYGGTLEDIQNEISKISAQDALNYQSLLNESKKIFKVGFSQLAHRPFHSFFEMFKLIPTMIKLKSYRSVYSLVSSHMAHDKLRQAFSIQPLLVGGNPFNTTSIYSLIHFLEFKDGIHFARGGMGKLVSALIKLMEEEGVKIYTDTKLEKIIYKKNKINSIQTNNGLIKCDHLISNTDPEYFYSKFVKKNTFKVNLRRKFYKKSMGLFVLYFGTQKVYENLEHHTIILGKHYKKLLEQIFKYKKLSEEISIYLHRPTATDKSMAPEGCDSFYALVPVPNLEANYNWERKGVELKDLVIKRLSETIMPNLSKYIKIIFWKTPRDFKVDYCSPSGTGFSIAPLFYQSAWFRYHNKGEGIDNLSFVGAGTHPGAGLPGVLSSAKVTESLLKNKYL